jgi:hypothetical protein
MGFRKVWDLEKYGIIRERRVPLKKIELLKQLKDKITYYRTNGS